MFLPYKVDVPMQRWPWANWVIMAITLFMSIVFLFNLDAWEPAAAGEPAGSFMDYLILQPQAFRVPQLVCNLFAHSGFFHLAGNMLFLWVFGNAVNAKIGHWQYVTLYLGIGIFESIAWLVLGPNKPVLGASGAIMGIVGAFLLLYPLNDISAVFIFFPAVRIVEFSAGWMIALYFVFDMYGMLFKGNAGIAYLAHVAGFLSGVGVIGFLLWKKWLVADHGERTLLQVMGWMPENPEQVVPIRNPYLSTPNTAAPSPPRQPATKAAPPPTPPRRSKPRDEGPIPLE
jgi:membrane associated rhomboid family serine protease